MLVAFVAHRRRPTVGAGLADPPGGCICLSLAGWVPWLWQPWKRFWLARGDPAQMRVGNHETNPLRQVLMHFSRAELSGQPLPNKDSTDDRYELLVKFQGILQLARLQRHHRAGRSGRRAAPDQRLGRADEGPALADARQQVPQASGLGVKLMLPIELTRFIEREERDFYQRARLDKQNMIPSFEWTGEALYDVANAASALAPTQLRRTHELRGPTLRDLFDESIAERLDRRAPQPARAAAPVQVHVPAARGPLQRPHRRGPRVADHRADV